MDAHHDLASLVNLTDSDPRATLARDINAVIFGSDPIIAPIEIDESGTWRQHLSRQRFRLSNVKGGVDIIKVKCLNIPVVTHEYKPDAEWNLPAKQDGCTATIDAPVGTTFDFVELPEPPATGP